MIDFHSHLDLYPNPWAVRDECVTRGLHVLSVTTTPSAWEGTLALSAGAPHIYTGLGLHPQLAHERQTELALFDRYLPEACYIGEVGLDGAPDFRSQWPSQIAVLEHILAACQAAGGRIISLHSRRASAAALAHLERYQGAGTPVLHWFSGSFHDLDRAIGLGCWFSVGSAMLAGERGRGLTARMPRERVLTESDGPFAQLGGQSIMPWQVGAVLHALGRIWSQPPQDVEQTIHRNLQELLLQHGGV